MAGTVTARAFTDGLVAEFSTAIESVLGAPVAVTPATGGDGAGWTVRFALTGDLQGPLVVWISEADASQLAQRVMSMDEPPDGPTIVDMLREMWTQAASALALKDPFTGVKADVSIPEAGELCGRISVVSRRPSRHPWPGPWRPARPGRLTTLMRPQSSRSSSISTCR